MTTVNQNFQIALQHHQAGRLAQAEPLYRQILAQQPTHADAMHHLGLIAHQVGRHDAAVDLIRRAIALSPGNAGAYANLGVALKELGRTEEAIAAYRAALAMVADFPQALNNLGVALMEQGNLDDSIAVYRRSLELDPNSAQAHSNLGIALKEKGEVEAAIAEFRKAIAINPNYAEAYSNLGGALNEQKLFDHAIAACRTALALRPDFADALHNIANPLRETNQLNEALAASERAISLKLNKPEAYNTLGLILGDLGRFEQALAAYHTALALRPNYPDAQRNLGFALHESGRIDEAIGAYRRAIAMKPDFAEAYKNMSMSLRLGGDLLEGWEANEWRWKSRDFTTPARDFPQPLWDGRELPDATLLLHAEQGYGDTIQFVRYLPLVARQVGKVVFECPADLRRLLAPLADNMRIVRRSELLGDFDFHCPLMSLPRAFATTLESIPSQVPYLHVEPESAKTWRARMPAESGLLKVGLVWAGNPAHKNDRNRSIPLSAFEPLARVPGVRWFSLQKGEPRRQIHSTPFGFNLVDWTDEFQDFADTAAMVSNLDLVIAVDTSVAHLAGAMGKAVWVLLPFVPDWRWLLKRDDSPWYPTLRLFRQSAPSDWPGVIARVAGELAARHSKLGRSI